MAATAVNLAGIARVFFVKTKRRLLRDVALERKSPRDVERLLERLYARQSRAFLATKGTTYGEWLEHGPQPELEEVRQARRDDAVWDRLVEREAGGLS
jgi:hypothetical protein